MGWEGRGGGVNRGPKCCVGSLVLTDQSDAVSAFSLLAVSMPSSSNWGREGLKSLASCLRLPDFLFQDKKRINDSLKEEKKRR